MTVTVEKDQEQQKDMAEYGSETKNLNPSDCLAVNTFLRDLAHVKVFKGKFFNSLAQGKIVQRKVHSAKSFVAG